MFNPLTKPAFDAVVEPWTAAVFTLLTLLPSHPTVAAELARPSGAAAGAGSGGAAAGGGGGGVAALGPAGGAGFEQQEQQFEQQKQQQQATRSTGEAAEAADGDGGAAAGSADKALEIASALKEHLQAVEGGEVAAARGGARRCGTMPQRNNMLRRLYWLVAVAGEAGRARAGVGTPAGVALLGTLCAQPATSHTLPALWYVLIPRLQRCSWPTTYGASRGFATC